LIGRLGVQPKPYRRTSLAAQQPARASPELRVAPLSPRYRRNYTTPRGTTVSHRPTRKREKIFGRFKSHRQAQRFLSAHDQINLIFRPRRYQLNATSYRHARNDAFTLWVEYTAEMAA